MSEEEKSGARRLPFGERLCRALDIESDELSRECTVEVRGGRYVSVRGSAQILLYTETKIRLAFFCGVVEICGEELACISYYPHEVGIEGRITAVNFEEVGNK